MVGEQRRRRLSQSASTSAAEQTDSVTQLPTGHERSLGHLKKWVLPGAVGMLVGAGAALAYHPRLAASANSERQQSIDNAVLFTLIQRKTSIVVVRGIGHF